jgi:hypothetical protein
MPTSHFFPTGSEPTSVPLAELGLPDTSVLPSLEELGFSLNLLDNVVDNARTMAGHDYNTAAAILLEVARDRDEGLRAEHGKREIAKKKAAVARAARAARLEREATPAPQRIDKAVTQLAEHPPVLDVLLTSLKKAIADPGLKRIRKIDLNDSVYRNTVADAPGGTDLLLACNYAPDGALTELGSLGHLVLQRYDAALLGHAITALEEAQGSETYLLVKQRLSNEHAEAVARVAEEEAKQAKRAAHLAQVPAEPEQGGTVYGTSSVSQIDIQVSGENKVSRRFESQDTLVSLEHFIRGLSGTPDGPDAELVVEDVTTHPPKALDLETQAGETLYALGLWPIAQIRVRTLAASSAAAAAERRALAKDGWIVV